MDKKQEKYTSRGITLIVLVITIIVMLILASVTIKIVTSGGIFDYAKKATEETEKSSNKENAFAEKVINGDEKKQDSILSYNKTNKNSDGTLKANAKYRSNGKIAIIPKGFKIIEDAEGKKSIDAGLVIQDSEGNEFVWVPVTVKGTTDEEKEANFENMRTDGYESGTLKTWVSDKAVTEPCTTGYLNGKGIEEIKDYQEMKASVIKNGGFYIGRYEAGVEGDTARTDIENGTSTMVVKRDKFPYNFVGWGLNKNNYESDVTKNSKNQGKGALYLSKHMYDGKDVGVTPTLCYGIQWDMALAFIGDENYNKDSALKGNYPNNAWTITRETAKYTTNSNSDKTWTLISSETNKAKTKNASTSILLTTGASEDFKTKNIYDLAGNVMEWTNEIYSTNSNFRVIRGGYYSRNGTSTPVSNRNVNGFYPSDCLSYIGFRPVLYIK